MGFEIFKLQCLRSLRNYTPSFIRFSRMRQLARPNSLPSLNKERERPKSLWDLNKKHEKENSEDRQKLIELITVLPKSENLMCKKTEEFLRVRGENFMHLCQDRLEEFLNKIHEHDIEC